MATNFVPYNGRVLIQFTDEVVDKTAGGLFIPQNSIEQNIPKRATVVAVAVDVESFTVGEVVIAEQLGSLKISYDGKTYNLVRHQDILGKLVVE